MGSRDFSCSLGYTTGPHSVDLGETQSLPDSVPASEIVRVLGPRTECLLKSPSPRGIQRHNQVLRTSS